VADRSVTVALKGNVKPFLSELSKAEAGVKRFRDLLAGMDATVSADADIRKASRKLDVLSALAQTLEADTVTLSADADVYDAMADLRRLSDALGDLDGRTARPRLDLDASMATTHLSGITRTLDDLQRKKTVIDVDVDRAGMASKLADVGASAGGSLASAVSSSAGPALIAGAAGLAASVGPVIGAALGGVIVANIGAQLTTLGVRSLFYVQEIDKEWSAVEKRRVEAANRQAKELQAQFKELGRDLTLAMQDASDPLRSVLDEVRVQARGLAKDVGPSLRAGFEEARVPLEQFVRDASAGLKELGDSIPSLMGGFSDVLRGLDIEGFLSDLGAEFENLGRVVSENRSSIGTVLNGLLDVLPLAIGGLSKIIEWFGTLGLAVTRSAAVISEHMSGAVGAITGFGTGVLKVIRSVGEALSNVPGAEALGQKIVAAADAGIGKLDELKTHADNVSRNMRLTADITELNQNIDKAMAQLNDPNLTKERRAQINAEIDRLMAAKGQALVALGDPALVAEYQSQLTTDISSLQSRLADARKELKDPELTKERKSRLNAEISELQEGVKRAKAALNTLNDKTVRVFVKTEYQDDLSRAALRAANAMAAGGILRYAAGGIDYAAAGGLQVRPQAPQIVSRPTVLFGEGSSGRGATEAYIPYEQRFRARAVDLLSQVADDFGFGLYGREADQQVQQVAVTVSDAATQLGADLGAADISLTSAFGDTGTLTGAITEVGAVGEAMSAAWTTGSQQLGDSVTAMGDVVGDSMMTVATVTSDNLQIVAEGVDGLNMSVKDLLMALATGKAGGSSGSKSGKGSGYGHLLERMDTVRKPMSPKDKGKLALGAAESMLGAMGLGGLPKSPPGGMIEGDYGLSGTPDWTPGAYSAISYGAPVNTSRVSTPQQVPASAYGGAGSSGGGSGSSGGTSTISKGGSLVTVEQMNVREEADIDRVAVGLYSRLGSKGP
jgi:hypothetical protein